MQRAVPIQQGALSVARQAPTASPTTTPQPNTPNATATNIAEVFTNASTAFSRFAEICRALKAQPAEPAASGGDVSEAQRWREDCVELLRAATTRFATDLCSIAEAQRTRQLGKLKEEFQRKSYAECGLVYPDDAPYANEGGEYTEAGNDGTAYETGYSDAMYASGAEYTTYTEGENSVNQSAAPEQYATGTDPENVQAELEAAVSSLNGTAQAQQLNDNQIATAGDEKANEIAVGLEQVAASNQIAAVSGTKEHVSYSGNESQSHLEAVAAHFVGDIEIEKLDTSMRDETSRQGDQELAMQSDVPHDTNDL